MTMKATLTTPQAAEEILGEATSTGRLRIVHTDAIFDHEGCSWSGVDVGGSGGFAYDPVGIGVMGFGMLLLAALALVL
jgi:hypothetical protein